VQKQDNLIIGSASLRDIEQIETILENEVKKGIILYRSTDEIAKNIRSYIVARVENKIIGIVSLYIYSQNLAEFRSLAVAEEFRGKGIGQELIKNGLLSGIELGLKEFLVLTYQKDFFIKLGFHEIDKKEIPNGKIWADCVKCQYFPVCDEVALIKRA
jgi:amino-acid N-acetyltransferase